MQLISARPLRIRAGTRQQVPGLLSIRRLASLSKDDIREAQLELRHSGLYNGSLDGVIGPQTKQALVRFQKENGLEQTATLDALTMVAMFGNIGTSEGSGMLVGA